MSTQSLTVRMRFLQGFIERTIKAWSDSDGFISSKIPSLEPLIEKITNNPNLPQETRRHLQSFWHLVRNLGDHKLTEIEQAVKDYDQYVEPVCPRLHDTPVHAVISRLRLIISSPQTMVNCILELLGSESEIPYSIQRKLSAMLRTLGRRDISIRTLQSIAEELSRIQGEIGKHMGEVASEETGDNERPLEVVIVEDDNAWLQAVASIVRDQLGVEPHLARSQKELMNLLSRLVKSRVESVEVKDVDNRSYTHIAVILDLGLPRDVADEGVSHKVGEEILQMLREFKPNADVIILTSHSHLLSVQRLAARLGVNPQDYILKDSDWEHALRNSLRRLYNRLNIARFLPNCVELIGEDKSTGRYIVRIDNIMVPLPPWLYYVFAVLCRHGQRRGLTSENVKELVEWEYGQSLEENVPDAIYRLREAIHKALQSSERYIETHHLIRQNKGFYQISNEVKVIDREADQTSEWEVEIDTDRRRVFINGKPIALLSLDFDIFTLLARSKSRALSVAQIASFVKCQQDDVGRCIDRIQKQIAINLGVVPQRAKELVRIVTLPSWETGCQLHARAVIWLGSESTNATEFSVLLVEDDPLWRETIRQILEEYGYNVFEADSVEEAIQMARAIHPSILCLDLELPEKSGGERKSLDGGLKVLKEVSEFIPDVGAVVITAYAEHGGLRKAVLNAGVRTCDFLQKGEPNWESKLIHSVHRIKREIETASLLPADMESVPPFQGVIRLNRSQPRQMIICLGAEEVIVQFSKNRARLIWTLAEAKGEPVFKDELIETIYESKKPKDPEGALKSLVDDAREDIKEALRRHGKRLKAESVLMTVPGGYRLAGVVIID
jgi:two-component system chemotaxis response regulator CheY